MSSLFTDAAELRAYAEYLRTEAQEFETIRKYVHATACDKAGFTGLLSLLQPGVDIVRALFDETLDFGKSSSRARRRRWTRRPRSTRTSTRFSGGSSRGC